MTTIHCASDLVEESVFLYMQEKADVVDALLWQGQRDALYGSATESEHDGAFQSHARLWFERLALARPIEMSLATFPRVRAALERLDVRRVLRAREEGSELYGSPDPASASTRWLALGVLPQRFLVPDKLEELALRELLYTDDLLDPAFGYDPRRAEAEPDPARRQLARHRFDALWRARIDGRLQRRQGASASAPAADARFRAAFGRASDPRALDELYRAAWSGQLATCAQLLDGALSGVDSASRSSTPAGSARSAARRGG